MVDILRAVGIVPDGIIGHSVGELGCAYADGSLTAEEMVLAAYFRGKASLESENIKGMMAAIGNYRFEYDNNNVLLIDIFIISLNPKTANQSKKIIADCLHDLNII